MRVRNWSLGYTFGYFLVFIGIRSFYRKYKVVGKENIPKDKPILFAGNHQNAFLEGAILGDVTRKPIYFLGRSDIFKKKFARFMLNSLNALPIYRERDGDDYRKKNDEVFEQFYDLLKKRRPIVIFPEGNHGKYQQLRDLKKGVFRIGVGAENKYNRELDVQVVPVGINYDKFEKMGGDLLVQFGEPIPLRNYIVDDLEKQEEIFIELVDDLRLRLSREMIDIQNMDYYDLIHGTMKNFDEEIALLENDTKSDLVSVFQRQKRYIEKAESKIERDQPEANRVKQIAADFTSLLKENELKSWLFKKDKHAVLGDILFLLLFFPIHLYGMVNSYLPYRIPAWLVEIKVKDIHFHASIKVISGALLFVMFWSIQVSLVAVFTDDFIWGVYFISLILSAWFSYEYWITLIKVKGKLRYNKIQKLKSEEFIEMQNKYADLKEFVRKSYQQ